MPRKKPAERCQHRKTCTENAASTGMNRLPAQIAVLFAAILTVSPHRWDSLAVPLSLPQGADSKVPAQTSAQTSQIPAALPKGKKLILTDGTYQVAREYTVDGDRVRYWSVERSQWEEIPASLVDWDATHKGEAEQAARDAELKSKIRASNMARLAKEINVDSSLEIKPGLFLPDAIGLYAVDRNKEIREMKQSEAEVKVSAGREAERILTGVPMIPRKKTMDIPGERAAMRLTTAEPEFFLRPADEREPRFRLLRAQVKGGRRIIDDISVRFTGEESHKANEMEIQTWTPATGVFRYTVDQKLEPGEYAFVEMTADGVSGYVWDFGIDLPGTKPSK
jgi:hypothetical protein